MGLWSEAPTGIVPTADKLTRGGVAFPGRPRLWSRQVFCWRPFQGDASQRSALSLKSESLLPFQVCQLASQRASVAVRLEPEQSILLSRFLVNCHFEAILTGPTRPEGRHRSASRFLAGLNPSRALAMRLAMLADRSTAALVMAGSALSNLSASQAKCRRSVSSDSRQRQTVSAQWSFEAAASPRSSRRWNVLAQQPSCSARSAIVFCLMGVSVCRCQW